MHLTKEEATQQCQPATTLLSECSDQQPQSPWDHDASMTAHHFPALPAKFLPFVLGAF